MKRLCFIGVFLFFLWDIYAQHSVEIKGWITDEQDLPIAEASVRTKDGKIGVITDRHGYFQFRIPEDCKYLVISYLGKQTRQVAVKPELHVRLQDQVNELEETLVVAYGKARKRSFAGAANEIKTENLKGRPLTVISTALEGMVPGVQTGEANGQPGADISIRIRGFGSVNADNAPIYVVDGAIYRGAISDINSNDIESMTVLKDAAATALYGSSAGNGVVLITTKIAHDTKPTLRFSMKQGFTDRAVPEYDRVGIHEYYPLQWEMKKNGYLLSGMNETEAAEKASANIYNYIRYNPYLGIANDEIVTTDGQLNPAATALVCEGDLDWEGALRRKGYRGEYHISYGMRNTKNDFYASLGYLQENGYLIKEDIERFSARIQGNLRPLEWLRTGLSLNFVRTNYNMANTQDNATNGVNPFYFTRYMGSVYPIHQHKMEDGSYLSDAAHDYLYDYGERGTGIAGLANRNIVEETRKNKDYSERNGINGRAYADVYLLPGLKATANLSLESYDSRKKNYTMVGPASSPGRLSLSTNRATTLTANQLLHYERSFGKHAVSALAGHESFAYKYEYLYGNKIDQILENVYEMSDFQTVYRLTSYTDFYRKEGYFLQLGYDFDQKYNFSASYRRDGSSRFEAAHRWGNFWSVGLSWRMERENFMKGVKWLDYLKWRVSYGETGNDNILQSTTLPNTFASNYYPYQSLYDLGVNNGTEAGMAFSSYGNKLLKWETQASFDLAAEFGLFRWLTGSVEYFQKNSRDLLFNVPQVLSSGNSSVWRNVGEVSNRGVELALNFKFIDTPDWTWKFGGHATFLKNKIQKMPGSQPEIIDGTRKLKVGESLYNFWLKDFRGVNPENGFVQYAFDSKNAKWNPKTCFVNEQGDSLTYNNSYARYHYAGSPLPKVYGGLNTSLRYKNIELAAVISYSIGGKVYNTGYQVLMYNGKYGQHLHADIRKRWQKPGDVTDVPRLTDSESAEATTGLKLADQANATSDRWLVDASYLNVKSVTLRYRLPRILLNKLGIQEADIFAAGDNLYLWTAMKGMDPRQLFKGVISVSNTPARTFTLGLSLTL